MRQFVCFYQVFVVVAALLLCLGVHSVLMGWALTLGSISSMVMELSLYLEKRFPKLP